MTRSITARILLTCWLNSFSQSSSLRCGGFLMGVSMSFPTYPLLPIQLVGSSVTRASDSLMRCVSCRLPSIASEIHARRPESVQATWTFIPVVLCLPEYRPGHDAQDQHGSSVPSTTYWVRSSRSSAVGTHAAST